MWILRKGIWKITNLLNFKWPERFTVRTWTGHYIDDTVKSASFPLIGAPYAIYIYLRPPHIVIWQQTHCISLPRGHRRIFPGGNLIQGSGPKLHSWNINGLWVHVTANERQSGVYAIERDSRHLTRFGGDDRWYEFDIMEYWQR